MKKNKKRPDNRKIPNYFSLIAIAPAVLSVMAYEFVIFILHVIRGDAYSYNPIDGIAILVPMALLMELFTFFFSRILVKKITRITNAIDEVSSGNYEYHLDEDHMAPFLNVVDNFNKMTTELGSVETLRTNFIKDFSHEFKTPIVSIHGFAELLLSGNVPKEKEQEYLTIIAEESKRLSHLSEQTLLMSKLDAQSILSGTSTYSLDEQLRQNIILLSSQWDAKGIDMDVDLSPMCFTGNKELMSHVFLNILNNAIKFTPEHGLIAVHGETIGTRLVISIRDNGCGIPADKINHIFQRFYQADASHASQGLGLGLSIADKIVQLSGGEILVNSDVGEGSTFTINLPEGQKENEHGNNFSR